jgi:hypothetical protein
LHREDHISNRSEGHTIESHSNAAQLDTSSKETNSSPPEKEESSDTRASSSEYGNSDEGHPEDEVVVVSVVTRGTSPTPPPPLTAFTRTKRLEPIPKVVRRELKRSLLSRIETRDREQQVEGSGAEGSSRSRFTSRYNGGSGGRSFGVPWASSYIDKFSSPGGAGCTTASFAARSNYGSPHDLHDLHEQRLPERGAAPRRHQKQLEHILLFLLLDVLVLLVIVDVD